jgi:hypothetical protein
MLATALRLIGNKTGRGRETRKLLQESNREGTVSPEQEVLLYPLWRLHLLERHPDNLPGLAVKSMNCFKRVISIKQMSDKFYSPNNFQWK